MHTEQYQETKRFVQQHLNGLLEGAETFSREAWKKCGEFGIFALPFPEEDGGLNSDLVDLATTIEALGEFCHDRGLIFSICAHLLACSVPLWKFAGPEQKQKYLQKMITGEWIAANAMTEPESGSDAFSMQTTAKKVQGGYQINGSKIYATNAPVADLLIAYAKTAPEFGFMGISAFIIPTNTPGVKVGSAFEKIGLRSSPMGAVYFEDCFVPEEQRIGREGNGARIFEISMNWERTFLFAFYVGMMQQQFQETLQQVKSRKQFNKELISYQAVSHRLVDMKLRLEVSRHLLYQAVRSLQNNSSQHLVDSCLAKLYISEAAVQSGLDAIQLHGGYGITCESGIEATLRDAIPARIFSGTNEIMKEKIVQQLVREMSS